jgi:hypothetical protein
MTEKKTKDGETAVVPKGTAAVQTVDMAKYADQGFDNQTSEDVAIPFVDVLQPTERKDDPRSEDEPRGKPGDLFNTITRELSDEKILVPCITEHVFIEWNAKKDADGKDVVVQGGNGPHGFYSPQDPIVTRAKAQAKAMGLKFGTYFHPDNPNHSLVETYNIYGLDLDVPDADCDNGMFCLSFTSTKIREYKRINTMLTNFRLETEDGRKIRPALFSHRLRVTSRKEQNDDGKFFVFDVRPVNGAVKDSLVQHESILEAGERLKEMIQAGAARAVFEDVEIGDQGDVTTVAAGAVDDLPF